MQTVSLRRFPCSPQVSRVSQLCRVVVVVVVVVVVMVVVYVRGRRGAEEGGNRFKLHAAS
jgi:hypothetical protein